jgi:hypothetical protein
MQKYCFAIKTRSGQFIERISIAGKNREDAERKLNQMYRHCEIVRCDLHVPAAAKRSASFTEETLSIP